MSRHEAVDAGHVRLRGIGALRLLLALLVLTAHAFTLYGYKTEPLLNLTGIYGGHLAVYGFFAISGYLITLSAERQHTLWSFAERRFMRIMPALAVCLVACVLVFGAMATSLPLQEYFLRIRTWEFIPKGLTLMHFQLDLPGVFDDGRYVPKVVNGSIWTLPLEAALYLLTYALTRYERVRTATWIGFSILMLAIYSVLPTELAKRAIPYTWIIPEMAFPCIPFYAAGALMALYRARFPLTVPIAAVALLAWWASFRTPLVIPVTAVCLPYVLFTLTQGIPTASRQ